MRKHFEYEGEPVYTSRRSTTFANRSQGKLGYRPLPENPRLREQVIFTEEYGWLNDHMFRFWFFSEGRPFPIPGRVGRVYTTCFGLNEIKHGTSHQTGYKQIVGQKRREVRYFPTKGWLTQLESAEFLEQLYKKNPAKHSALLRRMRKVALALRGQY